MRRLLSLIVILLLAACSFEEAPAGELPHTLGDYPSIVSPGTSFEVTLVSDVDKPLTISDLKTPDGIEVSTGAEEGGPVGVTVAQDTPLADGTAVTITVSVTEDAEPGDYQLSLVVNAGLQHSQVSLPFTVVAATLSFTPSPVEVVIGEEATVTVATSVSGLEGAALEVAEVPEALLVRPTGHVLLIEALAPCPDPCEVTVLIRSGDTVLARAVLPVEVLSTPAPKLELSLVPNELSIVQGGSATASAVITRSAELTGTATLTADWVPGGITVTTGAATVSEIPLTIEVAETVAPGSYLLRLLANVGSLTAEADLLVRVTAEPDFHIDVSPSLVIVTAGNNAVVQVASTVSGGFNEGIEVFVEGLPVGVSVSNLTLTAGDSGVLELYTTFDTEPGEYVLELVAVGGGITRRDQVTLTVDASESLDVRVNPAALTVVQGAETTVTVTISSSGGFSGGVMLELETLSGATPDWLRVEDVLLAPDESSAPFTIGVATGAPPGIYQLNMEASSFDGILKAIQVIELTVEPAPAP